MALIILYYVDFYRRGLEDIKKIKYFSRKSGDKNFILDLLLFYMATLGE